MSMNDEKPYALNEIRIYQAQGGNMWPLGTYPPVISAVDLEEY